MAKILIKSVLAARSATNPHAPEARNAAPVGEAMATIGDGVLLRADRAYSALMDRARKPEGRAERAMAGIHRGLISGAASALLIEADKRIEVMLRDQRKRLQSIDLIRLSRAEWARNAAKAARVVSALNRATMAGMTGPMLADVAERTA